MSADLHLVSTSPTTRGTCRPAFRPHPVNLTALAIDAIAALGRAAEHCLSLGLTVAGAVYGGGGQPALRVVWHPLLGEMVRQGRAWDDGQGTTSKGMPFQKGHFLVGEVFVIWGNYEEAV